MGNNNFGIIISAPGTSVTNAKTSQLVMDTSNPFIKIDTQNPVGFQTINMLITTDPPEPPSGGGVTYTTIYKFKHGYNYIPSVEALFYVQSPPPGTHFYQVYFQDSGTIAAQTADDGAFLYVIADATYVYFIVSKFNDGYGSANLLSGTNILITTHVFVQDIGV
jgi:hypothetical protein